MQLEFLHPDALWALTVVPFIYLLALFMPFGENKRLRHITGASFALTIAAFVPIMAQPQAVQSEPYETFSRSNMIGLIDGSGSSITCIADSTVSPLDLSGNDAYTQCGKGRVPMIAAMRDQFAAFAAQRTNDQVAVTLFSDKLNVVTKLGDSPVDVASRLKAAPDELAGTDLAQALQSAVDQFREANSDDPNVLVLLSDGDADLGLNRMIKLGMDMKEMGVKFYWVRLSAFEPSDQFRPDVAQLVDAVGGKTFTVNNRDQLALALNTISRLEAPQATWATATATINVTIIFVGMFVALALLALFALAVIGARQKTKMQG
jgi:hypothetical protein